MALERQGTGATSWWLALSVVFVSAGGSLQAYASDSAGPLVLALLIVVVGIPAGAVVVRWRLAETRAFALMFGACVLTGGLVQSYALAMVGVPHDFGDAVEFFHVASDVMLVAPDAEHAWAVRVWQVVNAGMGELGFDATPGLGTTVNAGVMGLVSAFIVSIARTGFGNDPWRLRRVGTVAASCGLFLLFGGLMLRDCFVLLVDTVWVWAVVRWLARPGVSRLLIATLVTIVAIQAMASLRLEAVSLYPAYSGLAALAWYARSRPSGARFAVLGLALFTLPAASAYVWPTVNVQIERQTEGSERYETISVDESSQSSLGMRLVVNQPLPVRMVAGTGVMLIGTVPIWAYFTVGASSYHWLKGYQALFQLAVIPLGITGLFTLAHLWRFERHRATLLIFLTAWGLMGLFAVVATSLEQRHLSPFFIALVVLAALPDTRDAGQRRRSWAAASAWFATIVGVHIAWAIATGA